MKAGLLEEGVKQISILVGTVIAAFLLALLGYAVVSVSINSPGTHPPQMQSPTGSLRPSSPATGSARP